MNSFAFETGLSSEEPKRRYLWTDAFAVCNFLELYNITDQENFKELALFLVDQVHHLLGQHRNDDSRKGWICGLEEKAAEKHPTKGGLRIGKELNERKVGTPIDNYLEWKRDGQYFHYLTKWMHALNRASIVTGDLIFNQWARELAKTAHTAFTYDLPFSTKKSMYWKMSIDLSRPLVSSMGQHDPLDGFIVYNEVEAVSSSFNSSSNLKKEINELANICKGKNLTSEDPLGIGCLLCNAYDVAQLIVNGYWNRTDLLLEILRAIPFGLDKFLDSGSLRLSAKYRLAFRELGLSIGLHTVKKLEQFLNKKSEKFQQEQKVYALVDNLNQYISIIKDIEQFWLEPKNRQTNNWTEHQDINKVMLATSLFPDGYLG